MRRYAFRNVDTGTQLDVIALSLGDAREILAEITGTDGTVSGSGYELVGATNRAAA